MGACASRPSVVTEVPTGKVRRRLDEPETFVQDSSHALNGSLKGVKLSTSDGCDSCSTEGFDLTPREKPKRTAEQEQLAAPEDTTPDATAGPALQQPQASEDLLAAQQSHLSAAAEESLAVEQDAEEKPAPQPLCEVPVVAMVEHIIGAPYDVFQWGPPVPPCNDSRLKAVSQLPPVDADPDPAVDHIITLICQVFKVEAALLALFDDQRIFIRNAQGFQRGDFPWRWSFCAWCMATPNPEVLLVEDVDQDARFRDNEVAGKMGIKFYCGSPVVGSSGHRLGTLCFTDCKPRKFKAEELVILANLAELVARELEKGAADAARKREQRQFMSRALECFATPIAFIDVSQPGWRTMHCSPAFATATGITQEMAASSPLWGLLQAPTAGFDITAAAADIAAAGNEFVLDGVTVCGHPERGSFSLRFKPAGQDQIDKHQLPVGIPAHVPSGPAAAQQYFFVTLEPSGGGAGGRPAEWLRQDSIASGLTACSALSRGTIGSNLGRSSTSDSLIRSSASSSSVFSVSRSNVPSCIPVDGLTLGPLVGSGSFGRVYRGTYNGDTIAVKVCQPLGGKKSAQATAAWATLEARASGRWAHPNIVRALKHCTVLTPVDCNSRLPSLAMDSRAHSLTVPEDEALPFVTSLPDDAANGAPPLIANPFSNARCQRNADPAALAALAAAADAQAAQPKAPVNLRYNGANDAPSFVSPFAAGKPGGAGSLPGPSGLDSADGPPPFVPASTSPFAAAQRSVGSPDGLLAGLPSLRPPAISSGGGAPLFVSPFAAVKPVVPTHQGAPTFVSPFAASKPVMLPSQGASITSAPIASAATPLSKLPVDEMRPLEPAANRMDPDSTVATLSEAAMFVGARAEASAAAEERESTRAASNLSTCSMGSSGRIGGAQSPFERSTFSASPFAISKTMPGKFTAPGGATGLTPSSVAVASAASSNPNGEFNRSDSASTAMPPQQRMQSLSPSDRSDSLGNDRSDSGSRNNSLSGSTPGSSRHCSLQNRRASMEGRKNSLCIQSAGTRSALSAAGRTASGRVATAGEVETWLLLEYCDCGSLQGGVDKGWFRRERRTRSMGGNLNVILSVARDVCSAMVYLHKEGIVHGDLAGGNVLLTSASTPHGFCAKVSDFGLAQQVSVEGRCNTDNYGTVTHMPPEVLGGDPLTCAADVWSFGVLLWEMWCGVRAWAGLSMPQILTAIAIDRRSLQFPEGTPADFEMLATLCMSQNPQERPSFEDLHAALDKLIIRHINDDV